MAFDDSIDFELFRYTPSRAAAGIFVLLFFLTTISHLYQLAKSRAWYFIPFVIGGIFQIIGYIVRIPTSTSPTSVPLFSIQAILILLAPPLYAASIYMVLGRLITTLNAEKLSPVPVNWMTKIFVAGDIIAFLMQAAGAGIMSAGTVEKYNVGEKVTVGGLGVQLLFFGAFVGCCFIFHCRARRNPAHTTTTTAALQGKERNKEVFARSCWQVTRNWETVLLGLYIASVLILVRSVFRLVEYIQGNDGYLISHEAFMYVFDSATMFLAMVVLNVLHPAMALGVKRVGDADAEMSAPSLVIDLPDAR
ncbi:RTA1 like protein-domain-containing protein [Aspergillus varians]